MGKFVVLARRPQYKQVNKNGMNVRMRAQDYTDLARVCAEANVRFGELLHGVVRYALDNLEIDYGKEMEEA